MNTKYAIGIVVLVLLVGGVIIAKNWGMKGENAEESGNVNTGSSNTQNPKPNTNVGENPEGEADPNVMTLDMKPWVWISALYNDGTEVKPKVAGKFSLTFLNDGTFTASTDCNSMSGKYTAKENRITFDALISTKMYCEGSQEQDFAKILQNATSFFFTNRGELILEQKFDSGTATFR